MSFIPPVGAATSSTRGLVKLSGDLAGTADLPTVPGLSSKLDSTEKGAAGGVASLDSGGAIQLAQLVPGTPVYVFYDGTNWTDAAGNTITARPTSRTDIPIVLVDTTASGTAAIPGWALQRDFVLQSSGATTTGGGTAIFQWYGTGLSDGHTIVTSDAGSGDLAISTVEGSTAPTVTTSSAITPAVSFAQAASQICVLNWTGLGPYTASRARFFMQTPASWYASSQAVARFSDATASTQYLGVTLRGSGTPGALSLNDTTNGNVVTTPTNTLALSTWYRVEFAIDQTAGTGYLGIWDTVGSQVYDSGATTLAVGSAGWTRFRWGPVVSSVTTSLLMAKLKIIQETNITIGAS